MKINFIISGLLLLLYSCADKKILKQIPYGDKTIFLKVHDGGATTSFWWDISIVSKGFVSENEDQIFGIYGSPSVKDIQVTNDTLKIVCYGLGVNNFQTINIDLNKVDKFIDDPVYYSKIKLEKTNDVYQEPEFIKKIRAFDKANGLY